MPTIHYFWDELEDNVVAEYDDDGNTIVEYTTEPQRHGSVLSEDRAGQIRNYHFDGMGNTTELTDANGGVTDMRRYSAFGETTTSSGATSTPFGFGGRWGYHTSGGGPISIRRQQYELRAARWMSPEPLSTTLSTLYSPFVFSDNSPAIANDPSGLASNPVPNSPQDDENSKYATNFVFDSEGGRDGSLVWHQCSPKAKACISQLLDTIVNVIERDDGQRCFRDSFNNDIQFGRDNVAFRHGCRRRIGPCNLDSIRYVRFRCADGFVDPIHLAETRGMCVWNKKLEFVGRTVKDLWLAKGCYADRTCDACPPDHLAMTSIYLRDAQFDDPARCVTEHNIKTLIHELTHLCTGGHEYIASRKDLRVDASRLANDFFRNCGNVVTSQGRPRR